MKKRDLMFFVIASAFLGISQSIDNAFFNNFLSDTFHITVFQRTMLEFPRELPGFLVVFVSGALLFLGDVRTASIANMLAAVGVMGLGFMSKDFGTMMIWMTIYSMGTHLFMPMSNSIGMELAGEGSIGRVLGKINGVNTAAFLATSLSTAFIFRFIKISYRGAFAAAALAFAASCMMILFMSRTKTKKPAKKLFIRREYSLFYWLSIVNGARKQIFITFGPWVLIKIFNQGVSTFALLGFIIAGIGIFFKPFVGHLIDKRGEKFVLAAEAIMLIGVCMGYAYAKEIRHGDIALIITSACFVVDQLLTAAGMARSTYVKKIAVKPEDISPTLSMGISMDHAVSMVVPWLGGFIWNAVGYKYVFICGACIALINLVLTRRIRTDAQPASKAAEC